MGIDANSYSWVSIPAGFNSSEANPLLVPSPGTNTYILSINSGTCVVKETVNIYVYNPPLANAGPERIACLPYGASIGTPAVTNTT
jgi:hypothetical protein